jgi:hypothetical protein
MLARLIAIRMLVLLNGLVDAVDTGRLKSLPSRGDILDAIDNLVQSRELTLYPVAEVVSQILRESLGQKD